MRRYALRDDQWDRMKNLLPGAGLTSGVLLALFVEWVLRKKFKMPVLHHPELLP